MSLTISKEYLTEGSIITPNHKFIKLRGSISTKDTNFVKEVDIKVAPLKNQMCEGRKKMNLCPICSAFGYKHNVVGKMCNVCGVQLEWDTIPNTNSIN